MRDRYASKIYPLFGILLSVFLLVFGLVTAATRIRACAVFTAAVYLLFLLTGFHKACLKVLLPAAAVAAVFGAITYGAGQGAGAALAIALRFLVIGEAVIPGMSIEPVDLTRNLNALHVPRPVAAVRGNDEHARLPFKASHN